MNAAQASEISRMSAAWAPLHPSINRAQDHLWHLHWGLHGSGAYSDQMRHPFRLNSATPSDAGADLWL
jgi:hypothetical protein